MTHAAKGGVNVWFGGKADQGLWRPQFLSPTWLNNFPFPSSAPLTLLSSLSGWPEQAGANFLILGHLGLEGISQRS